MYHYKESGLPYVYLTNSFTIDKVEDEEFGRNIVSQVRPISHQEFNFIRIELNMSQKALGHLLGVDTQTVARWEKGQSVIPRTADVTLRAMYAEFNDDDSQIGLLLNILSDSEIESTMAELRLEEQDNKWRVA